MSTPDYVAIAASDEWKANRLHQAARGDRAAITDVKRVRHEILKQQSNILRNATSAGRNLLASEKRDHDRIGKALDDIDDALLEVEEREAARGPGSWVVQPGRSDASGFENFLRGGGDRVLDIPIEIRNDLVEGSAGAGGNLVPTTTYGQLYGFLRSFSPLRKVGARVVQTQSGEAMRFPTVTAHGTAAIVGEGTALAEADPSFSYVQLVSYKYGQIVQISRELMEDNVVDVGTWVGRDAMEAIALATGYDYCLGTGTNQPKGYTTVNCNGTAIGGTGVAGAPTFGNLVDIVHGVIEPYRQNAGWVVADTWLASVRKMVDDQHRPIFQPAMGPAMSDTLLGYPVAVDPHLPAAAINAKSAYFGDWSRAYLIRDAGPMRWERSDDYAFANDLSTFRSIIRTDGNVLDQRAYSCFKGGTA